MPDEHHSNRREDFRIDDVIFMRAQKLSEAELEARKPQTSMASRLSNMLHSVLPKQPDPAYGHVHGDQPNGLVEAIEALDAKLNYLIGISMLNEAESHDLKEVVVNISSTGMSFISNLPQEIGDYLQVILVVPTIPSQIMDLLAEVKWIREEHGQQRVGIHFCFRGAEERDSVARYVFRRQREMIRVQENDE